MTLRTLIASLGHFLLCLAAFVWHQPVVDRALSGDAGSVLVAVTTVVTVLAGVRLQCAVALCAVAKCLTAVSPTTARNVGRLALAVAPRGFKVGIACLIGVAATTGPALAAPMWPTSGLYAPTVSTPGPQLPSPNWPVATPAPEAEAPVEYYTVRSGDSLSTIANSHAVNVSELYTANTDTIGANPNLIHPGQTLEIP